MSTPSQVSKYPHHLAFCDGAAKGNPGPGGWGSIIRRTDGLVVERGGAESPTTNNRMELQAAIAVLEELEGEPGKLVLYSDSTYVLRGITEWISGWKRRGWMTATHTPVANADQWRRLDELARGRDAIDWLHVLGHAGVPGNERADTIASESALGHSVEFYSGPGADYSVDLDVVVTGGEKKTRSAGTRKSSKGSGRAHSYLSVVNGRLERHRTWPECERRVKGQSGARYRKAASAADEVTIVTAWGLSAGDLPSG
ncbi:MAG: ribonuclease HI [Hyphomicrobiaceae bacterium]|jgi:ribonuclease HI